MKRFLQFLRAAFTDVALDDREVDRFDIDAVIGIVSIIGILLVLGAVGEGVI